MKQAKSGFGFQDSVGFLIEIYNSFARKPNWIKFDVYGASGLRSTSIIDASVYHIN